ncbi:MAG: sulfotransferase [Pseudonocardiales bacterium]|nr:sulfotransferase [Pseudonocardiales bacterium]
MTGVPRSGTTWMARLLASADGTALAGREPMNPRGRQYALAGTLDGWTRLLDPSPRQRRALGTAYRGVNPMVYSRYGYRQWAAPLPWTRVVMKDPFALLSVPAVVSCTRAVPVLVYRHPGAVLASYRRMGWRPDLAELRRVMEIERADPDTAGPRPPAEVPATDAEAMGAFWAHLHEFALADRAGLSELHIVSHEELARGGPPAGRRLFELLDLRWSPRAEEELSKEARPAAATAPSARLHDLDRSPAAVAGAWRDALDPAEVDAIERVTATTHARLDEARVRLR